MTRPIDIIPPEALALFTWTPNSPLPELSQPRIASAADHVDIASFLAGKQLFQDNSVPTALRAAYAHAGSDGIVAAMPLLLEARISALKEDELWMKWYTCLSEEHVGPDVAGAFGKKDAPVVVTLHGSGLLTADRIQKAYDDGLTEHRAARFSAKEWDGLLSGTLPDGGSLPLYAYDDFLGGVADVPSRYGVVMDLASVKGTKSGVQRIDDLLDNPLVIARSGGVEPAKAYLEKAREFYGDQHGCWHVFGSVDSKVAQGRLLYLSDNHYGLIGDYFLGDLGRFVGVAPEALAPATSGKRPAPRAR